MLCTDGRNCTVVMDWAQQCILWLCGVCDWGSPKCNYTISHMDECPRAVCTPAPPSPPEPPVHSYLLEEVLFGIGGFFFLVLFSLGVWYWVRRRQTRNHDDAQEGLLDSEAQQQQETHVADEAGTLGGGCILESLRRTAQLLEAILSPSTQSPVSSQRVLAL